MLLIKVLVHSSAIHGLGVFAAEPVRRGQPVWRFTPGFDLDCDPGEVMRQPEPLRERLLHYGYIDPRLGRFILCCDDARFLNHSETPTLVAEFRSDRYGVDLAARDLAIGDELTVDYGVVEGTKPLASAGAHQ